MAKTKKPPGEIKWQCPICGDIRYEKVAGIPVVGKYTDPDHPKFGEEKAILMGGHFTCKGCSVRFGNPAGFSNVVREEIE